MADQENNNKEELEDSEPILDEEAFSLDLDDFDLGDDDLEESPGIEPPSLDDVSSFDDDDSIGSLVLSTSDGDDEDLLDIDLDSDLNLLGEEDPTHTDEHDTDFFENDDTIQSSSRTIDEEDLELEFDDDIIDLDQEIEAILNGEDGILSSKAKTKQTQSPKDPNFDTDEEDEGPIALSMEELANITGGLDDFESSEDSEGVSESFDSETHDLEEFEEVLLPDNDELESELPSFDEEDDSENLESTLSPEHSDMDLELDLDESEVDTKLGFNEQGQPDLDLEDDEEPHDDSFKPLRDPEEEELFGSAKEDENLTLSDDELGNILGSDSESLEESLANEDEFFQTEEVPEIEEDDGPITLSMEELENIGADSEEADTPKLNILDEELEDETITLSPDELGDIISGGETEDENEEESLDSIGDIETEEEEEASFDVFGDETEEDSEEDSELESELETDHDFDFEPDGVDETTSEPSSGLEGEIEEDEGPLALSMEELESIAEDAEESSDEELVDSLDRAPLPYEEDSEKSDTLEEDLEDESIALSMEELENITGSDEETVEPEVEPVVDEVETVTGDNIDDLIGDEIPGEGLEDISDLPMEEPVVDFSIGDKADLVESEDLVEFGDENTKHDLPTPTLGNDDSPGIDIDLDEYAPEGKLSPLEELRATQSPTMEDKPLNEVAEDALGEAGSELTVTDRKKVLGYLDNLLGNLPDDVIKEFSKSQYFDLYKKLMKELGL